VYPVHWPKGSLRQVEFGGVLERSETFIVAEITGPLLPGSVAYLIERMSTGSLIGVTINPPSWLLPPCRMSCAQSLPAGASAGGAGAAPADRCFNRRRHAAAFDAWAAI